MALPALSFKPRLVGKCCQGFTAMTRSPANDGTTAMLSSSNDRLRRFFRPDGTLDLL
jgi:hypothetical protein